MSPMRSVHQPMISVPELEQVPEVDSVVAMTSMDSLARSEDRKMMPDVHAAWSFAEGHFARGDAVLMLHYAYGAVKKSIQAYVARAGATVVEVPLPFPVTSPDAIIAEFHAALAVAKAGGRKVRLAVIDHITSMPSVLIPVKELVAICRQEGVDKVFVDAAHSVGQVPVDVRDIGADFYTSNLHKWFFCPPAVAFLHTRKGGPITSQLHHPVVSHEYGNGLPMESGWIGTRDYSAQIVVPEAIHFVNRFEGGIEGIRSRNHEKVIEMGRMLAEAWGTFLGSPPVMCGSMAMVGMPSCLCIESDDDALRVRTMLRKDFKVEVPIYYNSRQVKVQEMAKDNNSDPVTGYVRISHQVYNVKEEYERLRDAVNKLVAEGFTSAELRPAEKKGFFRFGNTMPSLFTYAFYWAEVRRPGMEGPSGEIKEFNQESENRGRCLEHPKRRLRDLCRKLAGQGEIVSDVFGKKPASGEGLRDGGRPLFIDMEATRKAISGFLVVGRLLSPFQANPRAILDDLRNTAWKNQGATESASDRLEGG
ncbi:Isopenicillin N epimerase [Triticum urartu]|uniref:Isopenicillin N epimerase n=1 Tax=Triticum urartu TaxID=4572 RepID=M8A482_TRIUA|nr:Isopenicillin N epimerase [Triticum urartu]